MIDTVTPTLLVDIGGTLLTRDRPGVFHRVLATVASEGHIVDDRVRAIIAARVLTGLAPESAAALIANDLHLSSAEPVLAALHEPDGVATILPGAIDLLATARRCGWTVAAISNVAASVPDLPRDLVELLDSTVYSSDIGLVKQDTGFWQYLKRALRPDPLRALVVGDDLTADVLPAQAAGYLAFHVDVDCSVTELAGLVERAGPPPPNALAVVGGRPKAWAGRRILEAPNLAPLVARITRQAGSIHDAEKTYPTTVVRRRTGPPAILLPDGDRPMMLAWLVANPDRRPVRPPRDLQAALDAKGLSLDGLELHEVRHLVSMVREAKHLDTRSARIDQILAHLADQRARRV